MKWPLTHLGNEVLTLLIFVGLYVALIFTGWP